MTSEYEIRVHVIEARDLQPREKNGTSDPICFVTIGDESEHTDRFDDVLSCVFDRWFVFNRQFSPKAFKAETVNISVYDANTLFRDEIIGSFELDLAWIHEQEGHEVYGQWVALMDPKGEHQGVQGYLKISCIVLGEGDEPADHEPDDEWQDDPTGDTLQSMVLVPPQIPLENYQLSVKVYRADQLIGMDLDGNCDPYVVASFAGSRVKTKVKENKKSPEWNEELLLPFTLPNMAHIVTISLMDEDLGSKDDMAAEFTIQLDEILAGSWHEPKWVNLYRDNEFNVEDLGSGTDRAKITRGRILISADAEKSTSPVAEHRPTAPKSAPAAVEYALRVDAYTLSDIPFHGKVRITARPGNTESTKSKNHSIKHSICEMNEQLEETHYQFPMDMSQVPDIFVSVYHVDLVTGNQRFGFVRLTASDLREERPCWYEIEPDLVGGEQLNGKLPGFILLSVQFDIATKLGPRKPMLQFHKIPYQVRAHIYQAKELVPHDKSGTNDPFCTLQVGPFKGKTEIVQNTNYPQWYETITLDVEMPEDLHIAPYVVLKIFDEDKWPDTKDFLGKVKLRPENLREEFTEPQWYDLVSNGKVEGSLLVSCQLIPANKVDKYPILDIHPETRLCVSELGILNLYNVQLLHGAPVRKPTLEFIYGDLENTHKIAEPFKIERGDASVMQTIVQEINVPVNPLYASALNMHLYEQRLFREDAGTAALDICSYYPWIENESDIQVIEEIYSEESSEDHLLEDIASQAALLESQIVSEETNQLDEIAIAMEDDHLLADMEETMSTVANMVDRRAPLPPDAQLDHPMADPVVEAPKREKIKRPLESMFKSPFIEVPFKRYKSGFKAGDKLAVQGTMKGTYRFVPKDKYRPGDHISDRFAPQQVVVRVYVLRGKGLVPKDEDGFSDPYLRLECGDFLFEDRENTHENTLDPQFYTMYEFRTTLPGPDTALDISIYDKDESREKDDLLGSTVIQLADRWFSSEWHNFDQKPIELRNLYNPKSRISQGKLELWIDIMTPEEAKATPAEDITPPQPERWQIRAIVWNVADVETQGRGKVDLFVTGKLGNHKHQLTDVHYNSPDGKGEFNWRLIWDVVIPSHVDTRFLLQVWDKSLALFSLI
eukprot:TRINITY_DN818_c0_g1_i2.p1 TRINITY_DN818_c0_g1~~TRINITY_DN818_c0_g1_i2.p1  ORF type:complete len:1117 (-),score=284.37 TRINITY_DN818_c0_g1_i2:362-3712(-)